MPDEIKKDVPVDEHTPDDTGAPKEEIPEVKAGPSAEEQKKNIDNAVAAALRNNDIAAAKKLLEADKPAEVDMTKFVDKKQFEDLLEAHGLLRKETDASNLQLAKSIILEKYKLSEDDASIIDVDDLKVLEDRAKKLSGRNNVVAMQRAVSAPVPEDLKDNELASRLL